MVKLSSEGDPLVLEPLDLLQTVMITQCTMRAEISLNLLQRGWGGIHDFLLELGDQVDLPVPPIILPHSQAKCCSWSYLVKIDY